MSAPGLGVGPLQGVAGVAVAVPGVPGRAVHTAHHREAGGYLQLELWQDMGEFSTRRVIIRTDGWLMRETGETYQRRAIVARDGQKRRLINSKDG